MSKMSAENKVLLKRFLWALLIAFVVGCGLSAGILYFELESSSGVQGGCFGAALAYAVATLAASSAGNQSWTMTFVTLIFGVFGAETIAVFWHTWH